MWTHLPAVHAVNSANTKTGQTIQGLVDLKAASALFDHREWSFKYSLFCSLTKAREGKLGGVTKS